MTKSSVKGCSGPLTKNKVIQLQAIYNLSKHMSYVTSVSLKFKNY